MLVIYTCYYMPKYFILKNIYVIYEYNLRYSTNNQYRGLLCTNVY